MEDEFNWGYSETSKDRQLKAFEEKFGRFIERVAEWDHFVVYDIDKASPYLKERQELIREYCDKAYFMSDHSLGIIEIKLPYRKPSEVKHFEEMEARRTPEEKRASEEIVAKRLKEMNIT